jgi:glycosidase
VNQIGGQSGASAAEFPASVACSEGTVTPTPLASSAPLSLDLRGGDVCAWEKFITGTCPGVDECASITIVVNGEPIIAHREGASFGATLRLNPGPNNVQAVGMLGSENWISDEVVHTVRLVPAPVAMIEVSATADQFVLDGSGSLASEFDGVTISSHTWLLRRTPRRSPTLETSRSFTPDQEWRSTGSSLALPENLQDGDYVATLTVTDDLGRKDSASLRVAVEDGIARVVNPAAEPAAWTLGATIYGLVVRNLGPGGFQRAIEKLDDLADLGVSAIWLAPINPTIEGGFGYEVTDYFDVRPAYGTLTDFRRFVDEAHARGPRVLMDFVPNHTSIDHPYCQDAQAHGSASNYHDFYERDPAGGFASYFDWEHLPNLNFESPEVRRFVTEAFMFWVKELDVDGFRVDVAWGVKQRRPQFWREFIAEFKRVKPDGLLIAEASGRDPWYVENGFDAAYDWTDKLGEWAWSEAFQGDESLPAAMLRALSNAEGPAYHPASVILRFLNNNDTGPRFITTHGVDLYRVASAMHLTLPGLPCIYTGDEVGAEFEPYATPGPIDWTDRHDLYAHFRKLIRLRKSLEPLRSLNWEPVEAEPAGSLLAYRRIADGSAESLLVLLNFSADPHVVRLARVPLGPTFQHTSTLHDVYLEASIPVGENPRLEFPIEPWGIRLLVAEEAIGGERDE